MKTEHYLCNAMRSRRSIRDLQDRPLSPEDELKIRNELIDPIIAEADQRRRDLQSAKTKNLFGGEVPHTFFTNSFSLPVRYGDGETFTAHTFIGASCKNISETMLEVGYQLEYIVLRLTALGFATCWLGRGFDRDAFAEYTHPEEIVPIVIAVGYPQSSEVLKEREQEIPRKPLEELCFIDDVSQPFLPEYPQDEDWREIASRWIEPLSLVRMAPSASNQQPWRIVVESKTEDKRISCYLLICRTPDYAKPDFDTGKMIKPDFDIQMVDIGVAMCHLLIAVEATDPEPFEWDWEPQDSKDWQSSSLPFDCVVLLTRRAEPTASSSFLAEKGLTSDPLI